MISFCGRSLAVAGLLLGVLLLTACATPVERAQQYIASDEWMKAVLEYRKAYNQHPNDVEYRSRLKQTELKAADFYYQRGQRLLEGGDLDGAVLQFQQGLAAMPDHSKLLQAMNEALARKEATSLYREGMHQLEAGNADEAKRKFAKAIETYPSHPQAQAQLDQLRKRQRERDTEGLALSSSAPITLNFRQTELRTAFEFLAKSFGVNVVFDDSFKSVPVTLFAKDVTFEQGFSLLLTTTKTFYKRIGPNTVLIAPDSKEKRGQYEDQIIRSFQLNSVRAKEMAEILKGMLTVKKVIINEQLNTITIRDSEEVLRLTERLIEQNDRKPAEIILDVEILEVNRTKADNLGLSFGTYQFTAAVAAGSTTLSSGTTITNAANSVPLSGSIRSVIKSNATLAIPSVTLDFFKQDVDGKTLANPKIRVVNGKAAKIHIGDRVPLQSATIVDATGQVRTTYDYKDIGVLLNVEPTINLDNSCTVKLSLEVSSLGANRGTTSNPAFTIGTRKAETFMMLRDGETAILGGLITEDEKNTRVTIPGLGDIPVLGKIFTSYNDSSGRTDVLLTITPRVVRGWDLPNKTARQFYSGSESVYSDKALFADLETVAFGEAGQALRPKIETNAAAPVPPSAPAQPQTLSSSVIGAAQTLTMPGSTQGAAAPAPAVASAAPPVMPSSKGPPSLAFSEAAYEVQNGQELQIKLVGQNLGGATSLPIQVLYNPQLLKFVRAAQGDPAPKSFDAAADETQGVLQVAVVYASNAAPQDSATLGNIVVRGTQPGISYLVYRLPAITGPNGESVNAQVRAARQLAPRAVVDRKSTRLNSSH